MKQPLTIISLFLGTWIVSCNQERPLASHPVINYYNNGVDLSDSLSVQLFSYTLDSTLRSDQDAYIRSVTYYLRGWHYYKQNKLRNAFINWKEAESFYQQADTVDWYIEVNLCKNLGLTHKRFKDFEMAVSYYEKGLVIARKHSEREVLSLSYNLGNAILKLNPDTVPHIYYKALELAEKLEDPKKIVQLHMNLGNRLADIGKFTEAEEHLHHAVRQAEHDHTLRPYLAKSAHNLARCYELQEEFEKSIPYYELSIANRKDPFISLLDMGEAWLNLGDTDKALSCWYQAEELYDSEPQQPDRYKLFEFLAKYDKARSNDHYDRYLKENNTYLATQSTIDAGKTWESDFFVSYSARKSEQQAKKRASALIQLFGGIAGLLGIILLSNIVWTWGVKRKRKRKVQEVEDQLTKIEKIID